MQFSTCLFSCWGKKVSMAATLNVCRRPNQVVGRKTEMVGEDAKSSRSDLLVGCHRPPGRCGCTGLWAESQVWRLSRVSGSTIACSQERDGEREEREREREREATLKQKNSHNNSFHHHATLRWIKTPITVLESIVKKICLEKLELWEPENI